MSNASEVVKPQVRVFYSYSRKDKVLRDKLDAHLSLLKNEGKIVGWHDRDIEAGQDWATAIDENLNRADLILLLISSDFLASDYCYKLEMTQALKRHNAGTARVIPVILRPCDWRSAQFAALNALPDSGEAVTSWENEDAAFANIAAGIRRAVETLRGVHVDSVKPVVDFDPKGIVPEPVVPPNPVNPDRRTLMIVAAIGAVAIVAAVIGILAAIFPAQHVTVTIQPPVKSRAIGKNLVMTIHFTITGELTNCEVFVDVSAGKTFDSGAILHSVQVSEQDKKGPEVTLTIKDRADLAEGNVQVRVVGSNQHQIGQAVAYFVKGASP
ncbi:MAG: toll/interleukin-1 receptor domain-containing protein [Planctomycetes bacterium]|nr:toll/interleukin-1 receptor domain-containing protein [Planctomycetota bacterium]